MGYPCPASPEDRVEKAAEAKSPAPTPQFPPRGPKDQRLEDPIPLPDPILQQPVREARLWYQWYFNTEQGRVGLEENRRDIIRHLWESWSPGWEYTDEAFNRSAASFDNPDFVEIVLHSYRHRHMNAPGEDRFVEVEHKLAAEPPILVPSIVLTRGG